MPVAPQSAVKTGRPVRDFTGLRFGSYLVLGRGPDRYPRVKGGYLSFQTTWICRCDCGREKLRSSQEVKRSKQCLYCFNEKRALQSDEAARRALLSSYTKVAKYKGIIWCLSDELFFKMTQSACHYCGKLPQEEPVTRAKSSNFYRNASSKNISTLCYNGIDRKDSNGGYEPENVVTCCGPCNHAKHVMSYETFLKWIARIRSSV